VTTFGICIYQESYMRIAQELAGFTITEADDLRKAIGKKIRSLMEVAQGTASWEGTAEHGVTPARRESSSGKTSRESGRLLVSRKAHAACYALIAYQTAWVAATSSVRVHGRA